MAADTPAGRLHVAFELFELGRGVTARPGPSPHDSGREVDAHRGFAVSWADQEHGTRLLVRENGRRVLTPMVIVMIALGSTDLMFALDSIPAIFGLTSEPYVVFTANVFALMGLRQLYFLIGGLLQRLVYLSLGLAVLLGFIGIKLILEALADNSLWFVAGGRPLDVPTISINASLVAIVVILGVTTIASLFRTHADSRGRS